MIKAIVLGLLLCCSAIGYTQAHFLVLKKKGKTIRYYWERSHISFQLQSGQWFSGVITKITLDSFYLSRESIYANNTSFDTIYISGYGFALSDVTSLPTKRALINNHNGQVSVIYGHERFVWIKNGLIFQILGGGYALLNISNNLISKDPPFVRDNLSKLGTAVAIFILGELLFLRFDSYLHIGNKFQLIIR